MYTLYTVFITIFSIPYYKLDLNTVYKYFITIYFYMCQYSYILKLVKYTYISGLPYGVFYHIKLLSLLIWDKVIYKLTFRDSELYPQHKFSKLNTISSPAFQK